MKLEGASCSLSRIQKGASSITLLSEGSLQLAYVFDPQGRRIQRSKNGQLTHRWLYLDQLRIAAELNADGSLKPRFAAACGQS